MLKTLRKIHWPEAVSPAGGVISRDLVAQVADYDGLINQANQSAEEIRQQAKVEAKRTVEAVRKELGDSMRSDFDNFCNVFSRKREHLLNQSAELCTEVTKVAMGNFLASMGSTERIEVMVNSLVGKLHSRMNLVFLANPEQVEQLESVLLNTFGSVLKKGDYEVKEDNTLDIDQVRVKTVEDAYIDISIKNIVSILVSEVEQMKDDIDRELREQYENAQVDLEGPVHTNIPADPIEGQADECTESDNAGLVGSFGSQSESEEAVSGYSNDSQQVFRAEFVQEQFDKEVAQ